MQALAGACGIDPRDLLPADVMEQLPEVPASESATPEVSNDEPKSTDR